MGLYKHNGDGDLTPVAGRGRAEYGASTVRTGTFTNPEVQANSYATKTITFDTPMPDADYELSFEKETNSLCYIEVVSKAAASFVVRFIRPYTGGSPIAANDSTWNYTAYKLYTDTEYNQLLADLTYIYEVDYTSISSGWNEKPLPTGYTADNSALVGVSVQSTQWTSNKRWFSDIGGQGGTSAINPNSNNNTVGILFTSVPSWASGGLKVRFFLKKIS